MMCLYLLHYISLTIGYWHIGFYDQPKFGGYWKDCTELDLDVNKQCPLNKDINYRSVKIHNGTCVEMNDNKDSVWITDDNIDLGHSFNGGYAKKCDTYNVSLLCPDGTFAKGLEWDAAFEITKGIKLSCYSPEYYTSNETVMVSHPDAQFDGSGKRKCAAIYGITFKVDDTKDSIVALDLKENCTAGYMKGIRLTCIPETALSGIVVVIEDKTKYVKNATVFCTKVPDIVSLCKPVDAKQIILSYNGNTTTTFTIQKKFGVGQAAVMSDLNRNEFKFYSSSGFEISQSISALSDNFKNNIGLSNETGFDWNTTPNEMWQEEQIKPIKIKTKSGCTTVVLEIVGRCSFMEVRSTGCVQVSICNGISNEEVVSIPEDIVNLTYKKDIVTPVKKKIHEYKAGVIKNNAIEVVAAPTPYISRIEKLLKNFNMFFQ